MCFYSSLLDCYCLFFYLIVIVCSVNISFHFLRLHHQHLLNSFHFTSISHSMFALFALIGSCLILPTCCFNLSPTASLYCTNATNIDSRLLMACWPAQMPCSAHTQHRLCCPQAQAHYPLVDVFTVSSYLDDLAQECRTRIAAVGATTNLDKLAVLNQLMFNPPADGRYVSLVSCQTLSASSDTPDVVYS